MFLYLLVAVLLLACAGLFFDLGKIAGGRGAVPAEEFVFIGALAAFVLAVGSAVFYPALRYLLYIFFG